MSYKTTCWYPEKSGGNGKPATAKFIFEDSLSMENILTISETQLLQLSQQTYLQTVQQVSWTSRQVHLVISPTKIKL